MGNIFNHGYDTSAVDGQWIITTRPDGKKYPWVNEKRKKKISSFNTTSFNNTNFRPNR